MLTQCVLFIGTILDPRVAKAFLPQDRAQALSTLAFLARTRETSPAILVQRLLGHMAATTAVLQCARLHRHQQLWLLRTFHPLTQSQTSRLTPPQHVRNSLVWWTDISNLCQGIPFQPPTPCISATTDASLQGWGTHLGHLSVGDHWPLNQHLPHISVLELSAIFLALLFCLPIVQGSVVSIFTDNSTALSYINHQGGTLSHTLCHLSLQLWEWCQQHNVFIVATHVPGVQNTRAVCLSAELHQDRTGRSIGLTSSQSSRRGVTRISMLLPPETTRNASCSVAGGSRPPVTRERSPHSMDGKTLISVPPNPSDTLSCTQTGT